MAEFRIAKMSIKNVEGSGMLYIDLDVEHGDVELNMSRLLNENNTNDAELLKAIKDYTDKIAEALIYLHKKQGL